MVIVVSDRERSVLRGSVCPVLQKCVSQQCLVIMQMVVLEKISTLVTSSHSFALTQPSNLTSSTSPTETRTHTHTHCQHTNMLCFTLLCQKSTKPSTVMSHTPENTHTAPAGHVYPCDPPAFPRPVQHFSPILQLVLVVQQASQKPRSQRKHCRGPSSRCSS